MPLPSKRLAFFLAAALLCAPAARALIIYGTDANDTDLTRNTTAPVGDVANPANDAPWANVIQFGVNNASGVYLGNGYILTANHVNPIPDSFVINGVSCNRDTAFEPMQVTEDVLPTGFPGTIQKPVADVIDFVDLKLVKVLNPPAMTTLPINYYTGTIGGPTSDLGGTSVLIGCGVGKGSIVTDGWNWGGGGTYAKRWGTNSAGGYKVAGTSTYFESLYTIFNATVGDESQIAVGDSGSGLFKKFGTTWKLTGVASAVSTVGSALYSPSDASFFVRMSKYAHLLRYENWANTKLGSPTAAVTADPDKDGLPNLLEYAFHTDPNTASASALPQVGLESGFLTLTYTKLLSATDLSYVVEQSPDASTGNWAPAPVTEETVATSGLTATIRAKVAITTETKKFLRLSVTRLP